MRSTYEVYQVVEAELIAAPSQQRVTVMTRGNPASDPKCEYELASAEPDANSSWYFVTEDEKFTFLTLSSDSWRLAAKCDGALHDATATDVANPTYGLDRLHHLDLTGFVQESVCECAAQQRAEIIHQRVNSGAA